MSNIDAYCFCSVNSFCAYHVADKWTNWGCGKEGWTKTGEKKRGKSGEEIGRENEERCFRTYDLWVGRRLTALSTATIIGSWRLAPRSLLRLVRGLHTHTHKYTRMTQESTVCSTKQTPKDSQIQQRKNEKRHTHKKGRTDEQ